MDRFEGDHLGPPSSGEKSLAEIYCESLERLWMVVAKRGGYRRGAVGCRMAAIRWMDGCE